MPEAARLSDADWLAICGAAKLIPDADARGEIERCLLVEYPAFAYDAKRVRRPYERGLRMLKLCDELVDLYGLPPLPLGPRGSLLGSKHPAAAVPTISFRSAISTDIDRLRLSAFAADARMANGPAAPTECRGNGTTRLG